MTLLSRLRAVVETGEPVSNELAREVMTELERLEPYRIRYEREAAELTARTSSLKKSTDPIAAMRLLRLMSGLSEKHWCAGWLSGLEFSLWSVWTVGGSVGFGQECLDPCDVSELRRLHDACGGWWHWDDEVDDELFVTTTEWLEMVKR